MAQIAIKIEQRKQKLNMPFYEELGLDFLF